MLETEGAGVTVEVRTGDSFPVFILKKGSEGMDRIAHPANMKMIIIKQIRFNFDIINSLLCS